MVKSIVVCVLMLCGAAAFAAPQGQLILSGSVNVVFALTVTPDASASSLDIEAGEAGTTVGIVNEQSNNPGGYKITLASANDGKLVHSTDTNSFVNYQVSYDGGTAAQPGQTAATVKTVSALSTPADVNSNVSVTFTGKSDAIGGTYSDTLTFEISAP